MTGNTDEFKLALVRYLHREFGYDIDGEDKPFEQLASDFKEGSVDPSETAPGHTEWYAVGKHTLVTSDSSLTLEHYRQYDANIASYLESMNEDRTENIALRYYQYLAVLFTEHLFDMHFNQGEFLERFAEYIQEDFPKGGTHELLAPEMFNKIAYWMATGSGKTIIMHINIRQIQNYVDEREYDNIILIAPTEDVASQHREKLSKSSIPNVDIKEGEDGYIQVTDIKKLKMGESGPKTVDICDFNQSNILLVDEGHKGLGSNQSESGWVQKRDYLSKDMFAFEYSATFASSLSDSSGYQEYSRSIIFDYSYGRFHKDGYGKDYNIMNISPGSTDSEFIHNEQDRWLLANLLSYYEKLVIYQQERELIDRHNIEKPLSVFIGNSVNSSSNSNSDRDLSDVQQVVEFLGKVITNPNNWVESVIRESLSESNEFAPDELFGDRFDYLREHHSSASDVYDNLISLVFGSESPSKLEAVRLTNMEDEEIGLTTDVTDNYIGVVTIGDTRSFFQRIEDANNHIQTIENPMHSSSLFKSIDERNSPINFLIGSKKFAEGWDSTRPSSMGLLNLGRSEGPLVVQMFGRGVRVTGRGKDGKRARNGQYDVSRLETLDVFGIRADYMEDFKEHLKSERVEIEEDTQKVSVDVDTVSEPSSNLQVPKLVSDTDMGSIGVVNVGTVLKSGLYLSPNEEYQVDKPSLQIETRGTKVTSDSSDADSYREDEYNSNRVHHTFSGDLRLRTEDKSQKIPLDWLDWDGIWQRALKHKESKGYQSLIVSKSAIRQLIDKEEYELQGPEGLLDISSLDELDRINSICTSLVTKFLDNVYSSLMDKATYKTVQLEPLDSDWVSDRIDSYEVKVKSASDNQDFISELKTADKWGENSELGEIFKCLNQLYKPVFLDSEVLKHLSSRQEEHIAEITPEGIDNLGEHKFIEALEFHIKQGMLEKYVEDGEVMILRNQASSEWVRIPKGSGHFYPDFVIWVCDEDEQHIILADPHGMIVGGGEEDIEAISRVNEKETESEDVYLHACLFARSKSQTTLDEARREVEKNNPRLNFGKFEEDDVYFIDDTVDGVGKTKDEVGNMLRRYLE